MFLTIGRRDQERNWHNPPEQMGLIFASCLDRDPFVAISSQTYSQVTNGQNTVYCFGGSDLVNLFSGHLEVNFNLELASV